MGGPPMIAVYTCLARGYVEDDTRVRVGYDYRTAI